MGVDVGGGTAPKSQWALYGKANDGVDAQSEIRKPSYAQTPATRHSVVPHRVHPSTRAHDRHPTANSTILYDGRRLITLSASAPQQGVDIVISRSATGNLVGAGN